MVRSSKSALWFATGKIVLSSSEPPAFTLSVIQWSRVAVATVTPSACTSATSTLYGAAAR